MTQIDHIATALDRMAIEYGSAVKLRALVSAYAGQANEIEQALQDCLSQRTVDTATGDTLDVIGDIVGIGRTVFDVNTYGFFGFADDPDSNTLGFGELGSPLIGGIFAELDPYYGLSGRAMGDDEYRLKIKAQILRNGSRATVDDIYKSVALLIPDGNTGTKIRVNEIPRFRAYSAGTTYAQNEYVTDGGIDYRSKLGSNTGNTPASSGTYWLIFGEWLSTTNYLTAGVRVKHGGVHYICRQQSGPSTTVVEPGVTSGWENYWALVSSNAYIAVFINKTLSTGELQFLQSSDLVPRPAGTQIFYTGKP